VSNGSICQVCGANGEPWFEHGGHNLRRCPGCDLVFLDPMPDAATVDTIYNDAYGGATEGYFGKVDSKMRRCRRRAGWLAARSRRGRFLDVGCNGGFMTEAMRERGFEAAGLDPDPVSIAYARENFPENSFVVATAESFKPDSAPFDAVYCSEVIEHSADVNRFVAAIAAVMAPGAVLFLTTPDISHWRRPRELTAWDGFDPPSHCLYFNPRNLARLLARHGLAVVTRRLAFKPGIKLLVRKAEDA
jgi:2-polyprenyl-3-methyl-5-hydroxy-6-metoxy-1,4-benzoquinol methylase